MKRYREQMVEFMENRNTWTLSVNEFFYEYVKENGKTWDFRKDFFDFNVEGISRCRRYITKAYWIWVRTKADKEKDYIEEYSLSNKF